MRKVRGTELTKEDQVYVLAAYVHRYTKEHKPKWAQENTPVQFASDQDWLEHTLFAVKKDGQLDGRVKDCESSPTWPDMPTYEGGRPC